MLTDDEIQKIHNLKERGYSKARVAQTLSLSRGTVSKYWGGRGERVSLASLKERFDECFQWATCSNPKCGEEYWAPKFLPRWQCPGCETPRVWRKTHFTERT